MPTPTLETLLASNPILSEPIIFEVADYGEKATSHQTLEFGGNTLQLTLTSKVSRGPLSGRWTIDVFSNGEKVLAYYHGGALGGNYISDETSFFIGAQYYKIVRAYKFIEAYGDKIFPEMKKQYEYMICFTPPTE